VTDVTLVQVPYMLGDERHGAAAGPARYLEGGAAELVKAKGARDEDDRTLRAGLRIIDLLGDYAAGS
jgi:hypothetical protein